MTNQPESSLMGQTGSKPTAQGQVESSINDTINFIMAKVAAGEIDAATATELIAAARKDYESNVPVTASAQQAVQPQQSANTYQANPQTAYAVPEMEPEQTPVDYGQFATPTNYPHTYDVEDSSDVDMDALSGIAGDMLDKQPRKKLSRKERKAKAKEMKKLQKETNAKLKANAKSNKSIQKQLKERDKELSKKNEFARYKRKTAKDVTSFIGYNRMYEDGICEVEEGMFSSCICFEDTSYHSVREDAQKAVFTSICRLYDQFGADTLVQFNIINTPLLKEQIGHRKFFNPSSQLNVNAANDAAVFNEILNEKMRQGVSNIRRKMYITFSVSAATVDDAVPKLTRIENQISQILTSIGSKSRVLDGAERLALLNSQLNPLKPFNFDYRRDISARMVQTTKDCIAPTTLDFKPEGLADCFKTGDMWGQVLVIKKLGSELTDQALSDITELPIPLNVTWFAQPMDKAAAVAFTRQRLAWIDKEIIEEQRSAVQKGYDFSILPQELKYSKEETEDVIDNLQNKNQRLYVFTGLFYTYAPTKKQLDNQVLSIISAARQNSIEVSTYEYRQRQGFNSILPLGHNHCEISRMSTTAEGKGEFTMHELLVGALRERPDRIVVGECRDDETYEMLQAMQTGHDGSLTTIHANDCAGAFTRIENMILKSQGNMTMEAIRRQIGAAIDVVVQVKRWRGGYRRIESITAVEGFSDGNVTRNELFHWEGSPENGRHVATGYQPARLKEKILDEGAEYDPRWFEGGVW